jgi:hypothetical protein
MPSSGQLAPAGERQWSPPSLQTSLQAGPPAQASPACAHAPPTTGMGWLRVKCCDNLHGACPQPGADPDASRVSIDGVFAGLCGEWPKLGREVRAGRHLVVVDVYWNSATPRDPALDPLTENA